eukprot:CAMPEP_0181172708 /NCGR_PEP_ID=MMETSP1096-20121128/2594_1 /TAXON_ID=156174 ORGANISM="Chrysochromulina ericina, Strain CCMP281" /NCGR_SAMPLE_ID=MMETSP1096 /ASSEMBLY_ACC=CAM_ASM_000453 /LENGTH=56 /DNA_ID=CAMNT_0023260455 /DNA_START=608 /DNA_END=774 /DNA_ORIENTATION=-
MTELEAGPHTTPPNGLCCSQCANKTTNQCTKWRSWACECCADSGTRSDAPDVAESR